MSKEFVAWVRLFGRPSITLKGRSTLTGPEGALAAIELLVEDGKLDAERITEITIFHQEEGE